MEIVSMGKGKKGNLIVKTWERCKSIQRGRKCSCSGNTRALYKKCKSWPSMDASPKEEKLTRKNRVAPEGCFSVYVGAQRQRFVIKIEFANHPLFKILLEEAESEYGFSSDGPLVLPCNVDLFCKVLMVMDDGDNKIRHGCGFAYGSDRLLIPPGMITINQF